MLEQSAGPDEIFPVAIAVAPNGGRRTQADHPALPLTAAEIAATAAGCLDVGAAMIHMHVRDQDGAHLLDAGAYRDAIAATKQAVGDRLIIQVTTEAVGRYGPSEQMELVRQLRPEAASLALRELAPDESHELAFAGFLEWMAHERIAPQFILYTPEEAARLAAMYHRGLVPFARPPVLYVLGRYAEGQRSAPADLLPFLGDGRSAFADWMVCAFGAREAACATSAALLGGNVRVGFENNLCLPGGGIAPDNAAIVEATANALAVCGLTLAGADMLRERWGLAG